MVHCIFMMNKKPESVLLLCRKLGRDFLATKKLGFLRLADPSLYVFSEWDILLIIQDADMFVKNDQKPAILHANSFYRQIRTLLEELHLHRLKPKNEELMIIAIFLDTKIRQIDVVSQTIMSLLVSTMRPFDYYAGDKSKEWTKMVEMRDKRLLLKDERHFKTVENASRNEVVLDQNYLKSTSQKGQRAIGDSRSVQEVEIINLNNLGVVSLPKIGTIKEKSTAPNKK